MSLITIMRGVPLYTTVKEALAWALANGVKGYHKHTFKNQRGYMGGATHSIATTSSAVKTQIPPQVNQQQTPTETPQQVRPQTTRPQPIVQPIRATEPVRRTVPVRRTSSGGGGGGGGGY